MYKKRSLRAPKKSFICDMFVSPPPLLTLAHLDTSPNFLNELHLLFSLARGFPPLIHTPPDLLPLSADFSSPLGGASFVLRCPSGRHPPRAALPLTHVPVCSSALAPCPAIFVPHLLPYPLPCLMLEIDGACNLICQQAMVHPWSPLSSSHTILSLSPHGHNTSRCAGPLLLK